MIGLPRHGNVQTQTITVPTVGINPGFTATQTYNYDSLNRIKDATENITGQTPPSWKQAFIYDRYGNLNFNEALTTTLPKLCNNNTTVCPETVPIVNPSVNTANNRLNGYLFDSAGNTIRDAENRKFTYDAENKQVKVETVDANGNVTGTVGDYFYDGDGKRVKKTVPNGETTIFAYDASGKMVAEYSTQLNPTPQVSYLTNDHLGSPRINTDQYGAVIARHDYHPFGEEITGTGGRIVGLGYGEDDVRKKFTGYERDNETDLDFAQARYFNSDIGRFSSPDYFGNDTNTVDPQSWNLYVYVRNNPLKYIDSAGKDLVVVVNGKNYQVVKVGGGYKLENNDGSNELVQASEGFINRLGTLFGDRVDNLIKPGNSSFVNVDNLTDAGRRTDAVFLDNGTMTTTSRVGIEPGNDESFVAFSTEVLVANLLLQTPNPYQQTSQNSTPDRGFIFDLDLNTSTTYDSFAAERYNEELTIRRNFGINPGESLDFGSRFTRFIPPVVAPPPVFVGNPNGTGSDPGPSEPEKPLEPVPCLRGQPPGCRSK